MGKNIEFTDEELEILHAIVVKEKSGLKNINHGTIFGKESLDNYFKDLNDLQLKIESIKKEEIKLLIITNTVKQATMKAEEFIEKISKKVDNFELEKEGITYITADSCGNLGNVVPIGLKVKFDKFYKRITIEIKGDNKVKEVSIKFMGSQQMYDGMRFDEAFIDYATFYNKGLTYNNDIGKQVYELEQKLKLLLIQSKYYKKELPQLVKMLLD